MAYAPEREQHEKRVDREGGKEGKVVRVEVLLRPS
jgi:hypothetical protein